MQRRNIAWPTVTIACWLAFSLRGLAQEEEPLPISVEFRLGDAAAAQGTTVEVPYFINTSGDLLARGYAFSVDFDETILEVTAIDRVWEHALHGEPDFETLRWNNEDSIPGNSGISEGNFYGAAVVSFEDQSALPPGEETEVYRIQFQVKGDAPDGPTPVAFVDGALQGNSDVPVINSVVVDTPEEFGVTVDPELAESFVLVDCTLLVGELILDIAIFRRGDSDGNGQINLSDSITTFNYLFLGAAEPPCLDAADVNDDGELNVTDGVSGLNFLFLGGDFPPAPGPYTPGPDPTGDELGCERGGS